MENNNYTIHSSFFNKYYCIIENSKEIELYYTGVSDFLRYRFKKIIITKIKEKSFHLLNDIDMKFLKTISKNIFITYKI